MAERGFGIAYNLLSEVILNIPLFKGARDQLNPGETNETARISAVIIMHVEHTIGE